MNPADKTACADCIQAWGFARDQARWDDLLDTFHPDGHIHVSWFNGPFADFVARCREQHGKGLSAKHLLWPSRVQGHGPRATAETNVAILVRQNIDGVAVDLTSHARACSIGWSAAGAYGVSSSAPASMNATGSIRSSRRRHSAH
jgi:hypothetical protein